MLNGFVRSNWWVQEDRRDKSNVFTSKTVYGNNNTSSSNNSYGSTVVLLSDNTDRPKVVSSSTSTNAYRPTLQQISSSNQSIDNNNDDQSDPAELVRVKCENNNESNIDFGYGPGIVKRLRQKFLKIAADHAADDSGGSSALCIRRTHSADSICHHQSNSSLVGVSTASTREEGAERAVVSITGSLSEKSYSRSYGALHELIAKKNITTEVEQLEPIPTTTSHSDEEVKFVPALSNLIPSQPVYKIAERFEPLPPPPKPTTPTTPQKQIVLDQDVTDQSNTPEFITVAKRLKHVSVPFRRNVALNQDEYLKDDAVKPIIPNQITTNSINAEVDNPPPVVVTIENEKRVSLSKQHWQNKVVDVEPVIIDAKKQNSIDLLSDLCITIANYKDNQIPSTDIDSIVIEGSSHSEPEEGYHNHPVSSIEDDYYSVSDSESIEFINHCVVVNNGILKSDSKKSHLKNVIFEQDAHSMIYAYQEEEEAILDEIWQMGYELNDVGYREIQRLMKQDGDERLNGKYFSSTIEPTANGGLASYTPSLVSQVEFDYQSTAGYMSTLRTYGNNIVSSTNNDIDNDDSDNDNIDYVSLTPINDANTFSRSQEDLAGLLF